MSHRSVVSAWRQRIAASPAHIGQRTSAGVEKWCQAKYSVRFKMTRCQVSGVR